VPNDLEDTPEARAGFITSMKYFIDGGTVPTP
jgi:hypothetical protein